MKIWLMIAASALMFNCAHADCPAWPQEPPKVSVKLPRCQDVAFSPSPLTTRAISRKTHKEEDFFIDDQSTYFKGVLLYVEVVESSPDVLSFWGTQWAKNSRHSVVTFGAAASVCPKETSSVVTLERAHTVATRGQHKIVALCQCCA
jgi:hypothetical protein